MQTVTFGSTVVRLSPAQPLATTSTAIVVTPKILIAFLPPPVQAEAEGKTCHGMILFFQESGMAPDRSTQITGLLRAWGSGDEAALEVLAVQVYDELRRVARRYMRNERAGNTLQTTALVNE